MTLPPSCPLDRRYDCAIPAADADGLATSSSPSAWLDAVELPGGIHAEIRGCTPAGIGAAIRHLYAIWLRGQPAFAPEGDPVVHRWGEAADSVTVTIRVHLVSDAPAWNMMPLDPAGAPIATARLICSRIGNGQQRRRHPYSSRYDHHVVCDVVDPWLGQQLCARS